MAETTGTTETTVETQTSAEVVADLTQLNQDDSVILDRIKAVTTSEGTGASDAEIGGFDIETEGVTFEVTELTLGVNAGYALEVELEPAGAMAGKIYWQSSDIAVATVSQCGEIYTLAEGEVTITATLLDEVTKAIVAECALTVSNSVE